MTDAGRTPSSGSLVCPFVALAEDRDRRADAPDEGNRCYAEKAPRRRDLIHQSEYCYTTRFASCSVFLAWAARNAAEPAYVSEAAQRAWGSGVAMPEAGAGAGQLPEATDSSAGFGTGSGAGFGSSGEFGSGPGGEAGFQPAPSPEGGLFGPPDPAEVTATRPPSELLDWVSASAWAEAPWDPDAEEDAEDPQTPFVDDAGDLPAEEALPEVEEALQGPKVPAALPMRRRRPTPEPIRARGSGEWLYADPLARESLVGRRGGVGSPILLAVLGLLVVALVVFLLPTILGGGGDRDRTAALPSSSPGAPAFVPPTRAPAETAPASPSPSPTPEPEIRTYTVKPGDTLSGIATKAKVNMRLLQCINGLANPNLLQQGQELLIPPDGYTCPPGWRRGETAATPAPSAAP